MIPAQITTATSDRRKTACVTSDGPVLCRHNIAGVELDLINYDTVFSRIECCRRAGKKVYITLTNPHSVMMCLRDKQMNRATALAEMSLPDGVGIILAAVALGCPHAGRVTGPSLVLKLCDWGRQRGYRHFFYGGGPGIPQRLAQRLQARYPGLCVAGTYSPAFRPLTPPEDRRVVEMINAAGPDILWVGLGAPKQEKWMARHLGRIRATAMIGVGAAFDFHSGSVRRAPRWLRAAGLEWAYRLCLQPRRMLRRNLDSCLFLAAVVAQRLGMPPYTLTSWTRASI